MAQTAREKAAGKRAGKKKAGRTDRSGSRKSAKDLVLGKGRGKKAKRSPKKKPPKTRLTARTADKHLLYEASVQNPEADLSFLNRVFKKEYGRRPMTLREDFCGTGYTCAAWVKSHRERRALGVDLDEPTLQWGRENHLNPLGDAADRVTLLNQDVRSVTRPKADVAVAFNFSYCVFHERADLKDYLTRVKASLKPEGLFVLDLHGGPEAFEAVEEETEHDDFTYVWDQDPVNPINNHARRAIHFRFKDRSQLKDAFVYDWRIWSLPELRDLMQEVGFARADVYWEGFDRKSGEGNGIFRKVQTADNDDSWIAYLAAWTTEGSGPKR